MKHLKLILPFFFLFCLAPQAHAAIARGARSTGTFDNGGINTTFTDSITVTGSNTAAVECIYYDPTSGAHVNGVKIGSQQMTLINTADASGLGGMVSKMYYLANPPTGAQTVTASSSAAFNLGNKQFGMVTLQYTGADQGASPDSNNSKVLSVQTSTFGASTTVIASNAWLVGCAQDDQGEITGAGSGTTLWGAAVGNIHPADSNGAVGTGSQTLNWSAANSVQAEYGGNILSLKPAASSPANNASLLLPDF